MYHLRIITEEGVESNKQLGNDYTVINREKNAKAFTRVVEQAFKDGVEEEIYCFVTAMGGAAVFGLHEKSQAYIMTESGATFSNLTKR